MSTKNLVVLNGEVHDVPASKLPAVRELMGATSRELRHGDILCHRCDARVTMRLVVRAGGGLIVTRNDGGTNQSLSYYADDPKWEVLGNIFEDQWDIIECFE